MSGVVPGGIWTIVWVLIVVIIIIILLRFLFGLLFIAPEVYAHTNQTALIPQVNNNHTQHTAESSSSSSSSSHPDQSCAFNPDKLPKCKPDKNGNCPTGFSHNESGNCFPSGPCPVGFHRVTDDESGKCFPSHGEKKKLMKTLKCNDKRDECIGFCSTANIDGVQTTFCFTAKECNKFRQANDGTKCEKTIIHD